MRIAVIGSGYVGLVTGACLSGLGHDVHIFDTDEAKIAMLNRGEVPIHEPGLDSILEDRGGKNLFFHHTDEVFGKIPFDVFYIAVGTPSDPSGHADMTYVKSAAKWINRYRALSS